MITKIQKNYLPILPGLGLSVIVAIIAKLLARIFPTIGGATIAIILGIILGNTYFKQSTLAEGTKFSESRLLEYSVVLLGLTVTVQTIGEVGWRGVLYVLCMMTIVISWTYWIGRKLGFSQKMTLMMAGGNAVCGSSAIGAIAPAIKADDQEKGQIITLVNLLGTVMMLGLPVIGINFFAGDYLAQSALMGGTLQSVGQVVAGASLIDGKVVQYAMLFKIIRILMLVVVVYLFGKIAAKNDATIEKNKEGKRKLPIPWYVAGFLVLCIVNSSIDLPSIFSTSAHFLSTWFETIALAAIGLRLDFRKFLKEGPQFLAFGAAVGVVQTAAALMLLSLLHL